MAQSYSQRAPFNDWWYWSECLVKRFKTMSEIYKENLEHDRAQEIDELAKRIKDNCMVPVMKAREGMDTEEKKEAVRQLEEVAIINAAKMFGEVLTNFPFMSSAIQDFLYIYWEDVKWEEEGEEIDEATGLPKKKEKKSSEDERISTLFWGPRERQDEGIRSGKVEDGGLPGLLYNMLVAEKTSSNRTPTDYGQVMQSAAVQQYVATTAAANQKWEKAGVTMNFKPGSGI